MTETSYLEADAKVLATALGATYKLARFGFDGSWSIRLTFPQANGNSWNFDMPIEGPHWKALVRLARKATR